MGPILPQINVFGKQLGISPDAMGFVTAFLPFIYMPAKPLVGYLIDYFPVCEQKTSIDYYQFLPDAHFQNARKTVFMSIILVTITCFAGFIFVPKVPGHVGLGNGLTIDVQYQNISLCNGDQVSLFGPKRELFS